MWGALISAAGALGSGVYQTIKGAADAKKLRQQQDRAYAQQQAYFDRELNTDATQRADAQRMISRTADALKTQNRAATARNALMGGSPESLMAQRAANARILGDTAATIAANGTQRQDLLRQQQLAAQQQRSAQQQAMTQQQSQNTALAAQQFGQSMTSLGSIFDDAEMARSKKKTSSTETNAGTNTAIK